MASYDIMGYDDLVSSVDREEERSPTSSLEETIHRMQGSGMCFDPVHFHSFRSMLLPALFHSCAFCERRIHLDAAVKCVACGMMAHRTCGLMKRTTSNLQCAVNVELAKQQQQKSPPTPHQNTEPTSTQFSPEAFPAMAQALHDNVMTSYQEEKKKKNSPTRKRVPPYPAQRSISQVEASTSLKDQSVPLTTTTTEDDTKRHTVHDEEKQEAEEDNAKNLAQQLAGNINVGIIAGSLAGGVAGLALAGPAGAYAGYISAGSMLVEGGVAWSLVAAGIGVGGLAAGRQQMKKRVLELGGENGNSTVLLVRPSVQVDPIWNKFYAEAQRAAPTRRQKKVNRDQDIFETGEDEIDTNDKILLLVNRTLNDKNSLSGYVFRQLVKVFHDRCKARTKLCSTNDSIAAVSPRARRDDVHAVIKLVTASLMEEHPELGASPHFTEITASAVESLVFGLLYDAVFQEIVEETSNRDVELWRKITTFEQQCRGAKESLQSLVSETAVEALKMLPGSHSTGEKLHFCVKFLDAVSEHFVTQTENSIGADSLIKMVCQHLVLIENSISCYSQVAFLEEFSRDEELLRGREGYALVTLQACLHLLQASTDVRYDVFYDANVSEEQSCENDVNDTEMNVTEEIEHNTSEHELTRLKSTTDDYISIGDAGKEMCIKAATTDSPSIVLRHEEKVEEDRMNSMPSDGEEENFFDTHEHVRENDN